MFRKLLLSSIAAAMTIGYASAEQVLYTDENGRKVVVNKDVGETRASEIDNVPYNGPTGTVNADATEQGLILKQDLSGHKDVTNRWAGEREPQFGDTMSTFSGDPTPGVILLGTDRNDRKVWINRMPY